MKSVLGNIEEKLAGKSLLIGNLSAERLDFEAGSTVAECWQCGGSPCPTMTANGPECAKCSGNDLAPALETVVAEAAPIVVPTGTWSGSVADMPRARPVGLSPYPCPRCRSVIDITVSYQGRREEWTCGQCFYGWEMNATTEQPT